MSANATGFVIGYAIGLVCLAVIFWRKGERRSAFVFLAGAALFLFNHFLFPILTWLVEPIPLTFSSKGITVILAIAAATVTGLGLWGLLDRKRVVPSLAAFAGGGAFLLLHLGIITLPF